MVSLTNSANKTEPLRDSTIEQCLSFHHLILLVLYYCYVILRYFFSIPASATDAAAVNPKGIKTL